MVLDPKMAGDIQGLIDRYITKYWVNLAEEVRAQVPRESVITSASPGYRLTP